MDHLVDYARSGKGQDGQGRASQAQARSTGLKGGIAPFMAPGRHFAFDGHLGAEPLRARSMKPLFDEPSFSAKC